MSEATYVTKIDPVTINRTEQGLRVQLTYQADSEAGIETISVDVLLKRENPTIGALQDKAVRRSIELLQQWLSVHAQETDIS